MRRGTNARRQPARSWFLSTRRALMAAGLWLAGLNCTPALAQMGPNDIGHWSPVNGASIIEASYFGPATRYAHGVLGDTVEWAGLKIGLKGPEGRPWSVEFHLPEDHVFEDLEPRLVDLDLDGVSDAVMVVETDMAAGAALALYGAAGKITETPHIGRRNRWLAPVGAADLDGDGLVEVAYIDRPHLAKTLRIWRFENGKLKDVASKGGLTNHQIGQDFITSGLRDCGAGPELITASASWGQVMASRLAGNTITSQALGPFTGRASVNRALACK